MKWFSTRWCSGEMSDDESDAVSQAYRAHVEALAPRLSEPLRTLAVDINLHDGLIRRICVDLLGAGIAIELRCGDLQVGYFDLDLRYSGVDMASMDLGKLRDLAEAPGASVMYDEVDMEGTYVHRILFLSADGRRRGLYRELDVRFRDIHLSTAPRTNRDIDPTVTRFVQLGEGTA